MSKRPKPRIPVNLIAGSLGVGKTTAINHLLGQRPPDERWAVLVNEYGQIGLDAALMEDARQVGSPVEVREVAGGCICCSAGFMFDVSLVLLLQRRPDRVLIEPTGLATVSGILDTLGREGIREAVDVRSVIGLVDPARDPADPLGVEARDQIEAADVLLASRSDLATPAQLEAFDAWAAGLFPPKRFIARIERGRVPLGLLDLVRERPVRVDAEGHRRHEAHRRETDHDHDHAHAHAHAHNVAHDHPPSPEHVRPSEENPVIRRDHATKVASTIGWAVAPQKVFDAERVHHWLTELRVRPGLRRLKAVLHTQTGWLSVNVADGASETKPTGYRRDSRLEVVWTGSERPVPDDMERELLACLAP